MFKKIFKRLLKSIFKKFDLQITPIENYNIKFHFVESNDFERETINLCRQEMLKYEKIFWQSNINNIAGVDEAGRGPLAGPVVASSVIFDEAV